MPKLILTRPRQFADICRRYKIVLDGEPLATIKRGQTLELEIAEGPHWAVATIDWCQSNIVEFAAGPNESVGLEVGSNVAGWGLWNGVTNVTVKRNEYLYLVTV